MSPDDLMNAHGVSRETAGKLQIYYDLLLKWQKAINLVSPSTLDDAWIRHFVDSIQVEKHVPKDVKIVADLGSGAGFPGLVFSIMRPNSQVFLVESDQRKSQFLRTVSRETGCAAVIYNCRIEDATNLFQPDFIMARALASLEDLCTYVLPWAEQNAELEMLFLKGENAPAEIEAAQRRYNFDHRSIPSLTSEKSTVLCLKNLSIS